MRNGATGANKTDYHAINVNPGRDFQLKGENVTVADVRTVLDGDLSPTGSGSPIRLKKTIEVGHVFKLGTKYSDSLKATFLDTTAPKPFIMGCYGIGLNRHGGDRSPSRRGRHYLAVVNAVLRLIVALDPLERSHGHRRANLQQLMALRRRSLR
jgi:hypothetical protein